MQLSKLRSRRYSRKEVDSLQSLALRTLDKLLTKWWEEDVGYFYFAMTADEDDDNSQRRKRAKRFKDILRSYIPPYFLQLVLDSRENYFLSIERLYGMYHEHLNCLKLNFGRSCMDHLETIMRGSEGPSSAVTVYVYNCLRHVRFFPNLRNLILHQYFNSEDLPVLISEIGTGCPHLEAFIALDINYTSSEDNKKDVRTDNAWQMCFSDWDSARQNPNPCCWQLKTLILPPVMGTETAAILLQNLSALVTFSGGCNVTGAFCSNLKPKQTTPQFKSVKISTMPLQRVSGEETSGKQLVTMSMLCPNVNHLNAKHLHFSAARKMSVLQNLTVLSISNVSWKVLSAVLMKIGQHLKKLQVTKLEGSLELSRVAKACPQLEALYLYEVRKRLLVTNTLLSFPSLKVVVAVNSIEDGILNKFLQATPALTELRWVNAEGLTDVQMKAVMEQGSLRQLEVFCVEDAALGLATVDLLLTHCPHLRIMGSIALWNDIHNYSSLLRKAEKENWAVKLLEYDNMSISNEEIFMKHL